MAKKTRVRLFLLFFIPIVVLIGLLFYSAVYSDNDLKLYNLVNRLDNINNNLNRVSSQTVSPLNDNQINNKNSNDFKTKTTENFFKFSDQTNDDNLKCSPFVSNQTFDINTIDGYNNLEFSPQFKNYWNYSFERKYLEIKQNWNQLPLKVWISSDPLVFQFISKFDLFSKNTLKVIYS